MHLDLTDDAASLLREILNSAVRDLSHEIADTDNSTYRAELRDRRDAVRSILDDVGGPLPDAP